MGKGWSIASWLFSSVCCLVWAVFKMLDGDAAFARSYIGGLCIFCLGNEIHKTISWHCHCSQRQMPFELTSEHQCCCEVQKYRLPRETLVERHHFSSSTGSLRAACAPSRSSHPCAKGCNPSCESPELQLKQHLPQWGCERVGAKHNNEWEEGDHSKSQWL